MNSIKKITFYNSIIFFSALFYLVGCSAESQKEKMPNIIYVLADDLGYGDVSVYNENGKIKTPNIDKLASEGIRFTDAHTSSAVCTPTRYGILTGRYNWRSPLKEGVLMGESKALIQTSRTTVASMLQKKGYHTAYTGKWHLGWDWAMADSVTIDFSKPVTNSPNDLGFDYGYGHCGSLDMAPYVYVENEMPTMIPTKYTRNKGQKFWRNGLTADDFIHDDVTPNFIRRAIAYVAEKANDEKPFFLYLPLPSPHTPILPTKEFQGKSGLENPYADFVMMVDAFVGQLLDQVKKSGIEENTLIIFASDNGCSPKADFEQLLSKGHNPSGIFRGHKADIFEGGHRVPFIARWPQKIKKGLVSDETICTTDFMATCADIVGYKLQDNEGEDSYSILPLIENKEFHSPFREATVHHSINGSFAIRKGDWKLIMCAGSGGWSYPKPEDKAAIDSLPKIQLYNLRNDPSETTNLQANNMDKVDELKALLSKYILDGRSTPGKDQKNDPIGFDWKQISFMDK
jgi:arylsulfatase A-like enzyme